MKLADFMHEHAITPQQLRWMLGVRSRSTVLRYINGERLPAPDLLRKIEEVTAGAVTLEDFLDPRPPKCIRIVLDRFGRPQDVFPWTIVEHHRLPKAINDNSKELPWEQPGDRTVRLDPPQRVGQLQTAEVPDLWPSPPLQRAIAILGPRIRMTKRGKFLLDGRMVDSRRAVGEANRILKAGGESPIPYPGVEPLV